MTGSAAFSQIHQLSGSLERQVSMAQQVKNLILNLIVSAQLGPGERIIESKIAKALRVGQPTVREALIMLEHQGLVVREPNRGPSVTALSRKEIEYIHEVREELELLAVELAAKKGGRENAIRLGAIVAEMKACARAGDISEFYRHDLRFHELLWERSGNPYIAKLLPQLLLPLLAFHMVQSLKDPGCVDMKASAEAHHEIAKAIGSGNARKARQTARSKFRFFAQQHFLGFQRKSGDSK
jgi:DNA-binding GntR family transcriptional regulator